MNQGSPAVDILGVPIHRLSEDETLRRLEEMALSGTPHHVMTVNPEFVMMARENEEFRNVLVHADLALPDGMGILWASRILGRPLKERIAGVDIVTRFAGVAARKGIRIFLLGAAEGVAERWPRFLLPRTRGWSSPGLLPVLPRRRMRRISAVVSGRRTLMRSLWRTDRRARISGLPGPGSDCGFLLPLAWGERSILLPVSFLVLLSGCKGEDWNGSIV